MVLGDISFVAETLLIEEIHASSQQPGLAKQANLSGMAQTVANWGASVLPKMDSWEDLAKMLLNGVIGRVNPLAGIINAALSFAGLDLYSIVKHIINGLKSKSQDGTSSVTTDDVTQLGKEAISSQVGSMPADDGLHADASFYDLLSKEAAKAKVTVPEKLTLPWPGAKGQGVWGKIFGNLWKMKNKKSFSWLLGGLVVWFIKTALWGAGFLTAGALIADFFDMGKGKSTTDSSETSTPEEAGKIVESPSVIEKIKSSIGVKSHSLKPAVSEIIHQNDWKNSMWTVPLIGGSIEETLAAWAVEIYPELLPVEDELFHLSSFNKTVDLLDRGENVSSSRLTVPPGLQSRQQIVDIFAGEAAKLLKGNS